MLHERFQQGLALHQQGQLAGARSIYEEILRGHPDHHDALHLLGVIAAQSKRAREAVELIGRAIQAKPGNAMTHFNRGSALQSLEQWVAALADYEAAIAINPQFAEAYCNRCLVLRELRRLDAALASADRAIALRPGFAEAHVNRGIVLHELGRLEAALASYDGAVALRDAYAPAHYNRGNVLKDLHRGAEALASYNKAIAIRADYFEAYSNRGSLEEALGQSDAALASFTRAIAIKSDGAVPYLNRANLLSKLRRFDAALADYDRAIAIDAESAAAHCNRGNALRELERPAEALACYARAIALDRDYAEAYCNRGLVLAEMNRWDDALASYETAIRLRPNYPQARYNRSFIALLRGDFAGGWRDHEWRFHGVDGGNIEDMSDLRQPRWGGEEPIAGRIILLRAEQGFGDTLQFCRYAPLVATLGATVVLEVPRPLVSLLSSLEGTSTVIARGDTLPRIDCWCPLLSLPLAFKTTVATIPARIPYLHTDPQKRRFWTDLLGAKIKPRVGLVWSGGFRPNQPERWAVNNRRNMPLRGLAALNHPGIEFYSLQKGQPAESELAAALAGNWDGPPLRDFTAFLEDFADTAALIEHLDLVISVDTATAHLAGALGKPVWLLNRFDTCWRWLLERTDSPWYPTMRIFRQERAGDWESVIERVREELTRVLRDLSPP
jgi:tetratricopeptide (TPR) repeat protein